MRFPIFGEHCEVRTFCSGIGRMWAERRTTVTVSGPAATVRRWSTPWRCGSTSTPSAGFRVAVTEAELEVYGAAAGGRKVVARLRHPRPEQIESESHWHFRRHRRRHRRSRQQCRVLGAARGRAAPVTRRSSAQIDAELEFRAPAQPGSKRILISGARRWITEPRQRRGLRLDRADERGDDLRVELRAGPLRKFAQRGATAQRPPIRPVVAHRMPRVTDRHDARLDRNRGPGQAVGVAAAVPALVNGPHERSDLLEQRNPSQQREADVGVPLDLDVLRRGSVALVSSAVRYARRSCRCRAAGRSSAGPAAESLAARGGRRSCRPARLPAPHGRPCRHPCSRARRTTHRASSRRSRSISSTSTAAMQRGARLCDHRLGQHHVVLVEAVSRHLLEVQHTPDASVDVYRQRQLGTGVHGWAGAHVVRGRVWCRRQASARRCGRRGH